MLGFGKKVLRPFTYGSRVKNGYCTRTHTHIIYGYIYIYIRNIYIYYIFFNLILYYEFLSFLSVPETSSRQHNLHLFLNAAKGSRFTLGVWGLRRVRWAFNRSQVSAGDRRESNMTVPVASSAKAIAFGGFKRRVASFRVAGVALCDISTSTCFITC